MRRTAALTSVIALLVALPLAAVAQDPPARPKGAASPGPPLAADDYRPAQLMTGKRPQYPAQAARNKIEGTVVVRFEVDEKGKVKKARISKGIEELNEAALDAVRAWKFKPAIKAGRPVEVTLEAPVNFELPQ
jgi:protein TonB